VRTRRDQAATRTEARATDSCACLSNDTDFTLAPASGQKTTVKLKAGKTSGTTEVIAKKGGIIFAKATYTVFTLEFTKKSAGVCAGQSAVFKAESKPAGKKIIYSIDDPTLGCSIVADGNFKAGNQFGTVKVRATLEGHSECTVTTDVKIHLLAVTVTPAVICNKVGETATATALLDGTPAAPNWSILPNDGKVTIDGTGKITVVTAPATDQYTVTATETATQCKGSATLDLVTPTFSKAVCHGFYAKNSDPNASEDTLMVGAGLTNTVNFGLKGKGPVYLVPEDPALCKVKVTETNGDADGSAQVNTPTDGVEVVVTGGALLDADKTKKTRVFVRVGSKTGAICKTLDVYVLKPVSLKVRCRVIKGTEEGAVNKADPEHYNLAEMQKITNAVWTPQAAVTFTFVEPIDECKIDVELSNPCTEAQRRKMIEKCGLPSIGDDTVQRLMFLVKGIKHTDENGMDDLKDGLARTPGVYSWMTSRGASSLVLPHELGHNFGLMHGTREGNQLMKEADLGDEDCVLTIKDVLQISR